MRALGQSVRTSFDKLAQSVFGQGAARVLVALRELAFPPACAACGARLKDDGPFCLACADEVQLLTNQKHSTRGTGKQPLSSDSHQASSQSFISARALAVYGGPVGQALRGFKYNRRLASGAALAEWLAREIPPEWLSEIDLIAPVPLHPRRLLGRGFNQAVQLFRPMSQKLNIPLACNLLARLRNTRPQVDLPPKERLCNVTGAFSVPRPQQVQGLRVLVVDDVYTTGATVSECSRALTQAGAIRVQVLTLARTAKGHSEPA